MQFDKLGNPRPSAASSPDWGPQCTSSSPWWKSAYFLTSGQTDCLLDVSMSLSLPANLSCQSVIRIQCRQFVHLSVVYCTSVQVQARCSINWYILYSSHSAKVDILSCWHSLKKILVSGMEWDFLGIYENISWAHTGWFLWHICVIRAICSQSLRLFPNYLSGLCKQGEDTSSEWILQFEKSRSCQSARKQLVYHPTQLIGKRHSREIWIERKYSPIGSTGPNIVQSVLCGCVHQLILHLDIDRAAGNSTRLEDACKGER